MILVALPILAAKTANIPLGYVTTARDVHRAIDVMELVTVSVDTSVIKTLIVPVILATKFSLLESVSLLLLLTIPLVNHLLVSVASRFDDGASALKFE